jgi:two-component system, OmpR family, response regulator
VPETRDVSSGSSWPFAPGMAGMPRSARSTTVPDNPSILACWTSTSNSSGVRVGNFLSALAVAATRPVPPTTSTKASGASRRNARLESKIRMCQLLPSLTVRTLCSLASLAKLALSNGPLPLAPADTWRVRILLVDDEERMVAALRRGLAAEGFVVESATDGTAGLQLAQHGDFDAIVLDVMLPGLSGYEVVRRLRARSNWVPVLMLSAKDGEYDQADALDDGADDYLTKPFSFVVLLARIRALLRRGAAARPVVLSAGDIQLDPASREVWVDGTPANLTPREFVLLEYLIRNAGRVVGKAELLDHVWANAADVAPNAVEVYVGYLRRKIGNDRLITVRGVGYRLAA